MSFYLPLRRKKIECKRFEVEKTIDVCDVGNRCQTDPPPLDFVHPCKVSIEWFEALRNHDAL